MGRTEGNGGLVWFGRDVSTFLSHQSIPLVEKGYYFLKTCIKVGKQLSSDIIYMQLEQILSQKSLITIIISQ